MSRDFWLLVGVQTFPGVAVALAHYGLFWPWLVAMAAGSVCAHLVWARLMKLRQMEAK